MIGSLKLGALQEFPHQVYCFDILGKKGYVVFSQKIIMEKWSEGLDAKNLHDTGSLVGSKIILIYFKFRNTS